ncbi:MAG: hypothetical protein KBB32_07625 [Spirochaetia bacterium]|nr:hypothetical protein [Spirochaetia bacterium]
MRSKFFVVFAIILAAVLPLAGQETGADTGSGSGDEAGTEAPLPEEQPAEQPTQGGGSGDGWATAEGQDNWRYDYDISGFKPGTYNILVRATDSAGNVSFGGPFNIVVDPESDYPVVGIANPLPFMRAGADLNVVGTCVDDDSVDYVEVRVDDGEWVRAEGSDYWSYYLKTKDLADGLHLLKARGVDSFGVAGNEVQVPFHLDRTKPLHEVAEPAFGTLVSGKLSLSGTVYDANGLSSVAWSQDGSAWLPLKYSLDKKTNTAGFSVAIDTRKLEDGPQVLWLRSTDGVGSEGVAVFLYFVDNTQPELAVLSPAPESAVNGRYTITGRVYDTVGVKSLEWTYGKESGQVELLPGNPYFSVSFQAPPQAGKATVLFSTTDITGNVTEANVSYQVDPRTDLPRVTLGRPGPGSQAFELLEVSGGARDDDGVASVEWRVDNGQAASITTDGAFSFSVGGLEAGAHTLYVRALDVNGLAGQWLELPFSYTAGPPLVNITGASDSGGQRSFAPGLVLSTMDGKAVLSGTVTAMNALTELTWSVNGSQPQKLAPGKTPGSFDFSLNLPASLPYGVLNLTISAKDAAGQEGLFKAPLYAVNYSRPRAGPLIDLAGAGDSGTIAISADAPLWGAFVAPYPEEALAGVELVPASALVAASFEGSLIKVSQLAQGATPPTTVVALTTRGHRFEAGPFVFLTDAEPPQVKIAEPAFGSWHKSGFTVKAQAADGDAVAAVEYSVNGAAWQPMSAAGGAYSAPVDIAGLSGPVHLAVRAVDKAGNQGQAATAVMVDTEAPAPQLILPLPGDASIGQRLYAFRPGESAQSTASVEVGRGAVFETLPYAPLVMFSADASGGPLLIRVTDKAGNIAELKPAEALAAERVGSAPAALGELKSGGPGAGSGASASWTGADGTGQLAWTAPFVDAADPALFPDAAPLRLSGAASLSAVFTGVSPDPKKPVAFWGFDPAALTQALALKASKTPGAWEASIKLPVQADGRASVWVSVQDADGTQRYTKIDFDNDNTAPDIQVLAPSGSQPGAFTLVVRAKDARGIASLSWEAGGQKGQFDLIPGTGDGAADFSFPAKGASLNVVVRAVDGSGLSAQTTATVAYDAAADTPACQFLGPLDGVDRASDGPILAYAKDDDGVASVSLSVDGVASGAEGPGPVFLVDPGALPSGRRSLSLVAVDTGGVPSVKAAAGFTKLGPGPVASFKTLQSGKAEAVPYQPGLAYAIDGAATLAVSVAAPNGLASAEYSVNGAEWAKLAVPAKPDADGAWPLSIPLAGTLPFDRVLVSLRLTDATGSQGSASAVIYHVAPPPVAEVLDKEGVYLSDRRLGDDGSVLLAPGESLGALWNGRPIDTVSLVPAVPFVEVGHDAGSITVTATGEGLAQPAVIRVRTVDGDTFNSIPLSFRSDAAGPELSLKGLAAQAWVGSSITLAGTAADPNGVASVEWSLDAGLTWTALPTPAGALAATREFSQTVGLDAPDGAIELLVRASDGAGRQTFASLPLWKDTAAPVAALAAPGAGHLVNGTVLLSGVAQDSGDLISVEYAPDGSSWQPVTAQALGSGPAWPDGKGAETPEHTGRWSFELLVDLATLQADPSALAFRLRDKSGNETVYKPLAGDEPAFAVDIEADKPRAQVQVPAENDVMRSDFVVSGMAFDDDGVAEIHWRVDGGEWTRVDGANAFSVPFKLADTADNEHLFEAYAVDLNGVRGDTAERRFRVSREEPVGRLTGPDVSVTNRGVIVLTGDASDANDIKDVWVSFDNGNTYNRATGTTAWTYTLDTRVLQDGVHSVYLKLVDGYDTPGFAAGLISVDNTAPALELTGPADGEEFTGSLLLGGRSSDAVLVKSIVAELTPIGAQAAVRTLPVTVADVFSLAVDLSGLAPGWYNIKVSAADGADNRSYQSRNIVVRESKKAELAEIIFPAHGERLSGRFTLDGRVVAETLPDSAEVFLGGASFGTVELNDEGYFSLRVEAGQVTDGELVFTVRATGSGGAALASEPRTVIYQREGPWADIDSLDTGDFVTGRPFLTGAAGWDTAPADKEDKEAWAAYQKLLKERKPVKVEISRDNGRSFQEAKGSDEFRYRLETQEYPNGELRLIVRVTYANGQTAVRKRIVTLDTKPAQVAIVKPGENGRFNGSIAIEGTAYDENGLQSVDVIVRSGDKASYEVPGFIQGSYLDMHLLGATRWEAGLGLSFFDDNVRLQANFGQGFDAQPSWDNLLGFADASTPASELSRFTGFVLGFKLLANLAYIPFGYYFGPDWDFFSMSFAMGATFTYFSQSSDLSLLFTPPDGKYMVLSGVVVQWEFAKFTLPGTFPKSLGLYLEGGLVFIPSEASLSLAEFMRATVALGLRIGLF